MYFSINTLSSSKPVFASLFAAATASLSSFLLLTILIPLPPPPAAALISNGNPSCFESLILSAFSRVGTFAFIANSLALILSPITLIT